MIDTFKASPAAYSYYLADEPCEYIEGAHDTCGSKLQLLGAISDYVRKRDPAHLVYVNLLPPTSRITDIDAHSRYPDYNAFLDDYVAKVRPVLLSFDSYNLKYSESGRALDDIHFITDTQLFARASVRHGIPFMAIVQGMSIGHTIRVPTAGELAFIANTTLAFGAQGISYFNYWRGLEATTRPWACKGGPFCGGIAPFADGSPTPVFSALQTLNPMFRKTAERLRGLQWMGVYLKGYAKPPADVAVLANDAPFDIPALRNDRRYSSSEALRGAMLGMFGSARKIRFAYVVNLDYSAGHVLRVTGPGPMARYDTGKETWVRSGSRSIDLELGPGQGALVGQAADAAGLPPLAARPRGPG